MRRSVCSARWQSGTNRSSSGCCRASPVNQNVQSSTGSTFRPSSRPSGRHRSATTVPVIMVCSPCGSEPSGSLDAAGRCSAMDGNTVSRRRASSRGRCCPCRPSRSAHPAVPPSSGPYVPCWKMDQGRLRSCAARTSGSRRGCPGVDGLDDDHRLVVAEVPVLQPCISRLARRRRRSCVPAAGCTGGRTVGRQTVQPRSMENGVGVERRSA